MKVSRVIASVFGIGYIPALPGTLGSLAGLLLYAAYFHRLGGAVWGSIAALTLVGLFASHKALQGSGETDPSWIVIDELLGMLVSLAALPLRWPIVLLGFCLFRFFDIIKLFPLNRLERLPGAWGVLLDDIGAGLYTWFILQIFLKFTS